MTEPRPQLFLPALLLPLNPDQLCHPAQQQAVSGLAVYQVPRCVLGLCWQLSIPSTSALMVLGNLPFPSFDRSITCIIWHLFHVEMKLFSETNPFRPHSFTLICGSWQEINSHFLCSFWLKRFYCIGAELFFWPANAEFVDQCPRIDMLTKERKWYFCVSSAQTWPGACVRACLKVTFRAENEQSPRCAYYCWRGVCFLAFQRSELGNTCSSTHTQTYKYVHKHSCLCVYDFVYILYLLCFALLSFLLI